MTLSASASFLHSKIFHIHIYESKKKHTFQNSKMSIGKCTNYFLAGFNRFIYNF
jgi:hypothetical protein